jgi:hypothetical protein
MRPFKEPRALKREYLAATLAFYLDCAFGKRTLE